MSIEFTVDHDHTARDDDAEIQLQGWIEFVVDNRPAGDFRVRYSDPPKTLNLPERHGWLGDDGHMYADQAMTAPFRLTANDPAFNTEHLTYRAVPHLTTPLGAPVDVPVFYFAAPDTDTTLHLTRVMAMPEQPVMKVRTHGYAEDILDATARGVAVITGDQPSAREAIDADTYGAYAAHRNGTADDKAVLAAADTAALAAKKPLMLLSGSHKVNSNLTITSPVMFRPGATIKPASGVTVTLAGGVVGNDGQAKIFDQSLGGTCVPKNVRFLHPGWWGPTGSADDSQTWTDMVTACAAEPNSSTKERILVPAGENRLWEVDIRNFHLEGNGRSTQILPPATATAGDPTGSNTGYVVKLQSTTTVDGVDFKDGGIPGITVVFWNGSKVHMVNGRVILSAANSIGIWTWVASGGLTPKLTNMCIQGESPSSDAATSAIGLKIQTSDGEVVNTTIHDLGIGIQASSSSWVFVATHVYQCQTGINGYGYEHRFIGCQIADCFGWGINFYQGCVNTTWDSGTKIWRNGITEADTGGMYLRKPPGGDGRDNRIDARFDDNYGTGLYLEGMFNTTGDMRFVSTYSSQGLGSPYGTDGIFIDSACRGTDIRVRTGLTPVVTGKVINNLAGEAAVIDYPGPVATAADGGTGTENGANTWAKLASFTSSTEFEDFNALYAFTANYASAAENGILSVRLRNQASNADPTGDVQVLAMGGRNGLTPDSFKLIFGAFGDPFELWVKKNVDYLDVKLRELTASDKTAWTLTYSQLASWQSATPTGTVGNRTSIKPELPSSNTTTTSAGTLTLTARDAPIQIFAGSADHTVKLPTTSIRAGHLGTLINNSTGTIHVQSSDGTAMFDLIANRTVELKAKIDAPTSSGHWDRVSFSIANTAAPTSLALRDPQGGLSATNFIPSRNSTVSNAGTLTLTIADYRVQVITGSTTHTVKLPTTGITAGMDYLVISQTTGDVTVQSSGANTIGSALSGGSSSAPVAKLYTAIKDTPTTDLHWRAL